MKLSWPVCAGNPLWPAIGPWWIAVTCLALSNSASVWDFIFSETGLVHRPKSLAYRLCNRNKSYFSFYIHLWNLIGVKNTQEFPCSAGFPTEIPRLAILGKQLATQCVLWYSRLKCNCYWGCTSCGQMVSGWKGFFHFIFLQYLRTLLVSMAVKTGDCSKILWKLIRRTSRISQASCIRDAFKNVLAEFVR